MFLARTIRRGDFLNARFGVNGSQNEERSLGTLTASRVRASDMTTPCSRWVGRGGRLLRHHIAAAAGSGRGADPLEHSIKPAHFRASANPVRVRVPFFTRT